MIAAHDSDRDACFRKLRHTLDEEKPCVVVGPVAIVKIAANYDEVDALGKSGGHQVFEGSTGGPANIIDWRPLVAIKAAQRAVEVQVSGV